MDQTRQSVEEALASRHGMTVCGVLGTTSIQNAIYAGHFADAEAYVELLRRHSMDHRLERWERFALGYAGLLAVKRGERERGLQMLSSSFSRFDDPSNTRYMLIYCEHALAVGGTGDPMAGLIAIDTIRERLEETGIRWYLPEIHRCRARLLHMAGMPTVDIEAAFLQAHSLAVELGAVTWQLRLAMDLSVFLSEQMRVPEAMERLEAAYALFSEGHGAPVLRAARRRLGDLAATAGAANRLTGAFPTPGAFRTSLNDRYGDL